MFFLQFTRLHTSAMVVASLVCTSLIVFHTSSQAQTKGVETAIAKVNGVAISGELLELLVAESALNGARDTPELRAGLKAELIARTVLSHEANRQGLDKLPMTQNQLKIATATVLSNQVLLKNAEKNPLTDSLLKVEYQRQVNALADVDQYLVSHIVLETQTQARAVLAELRGGEAFDKVAREKSLDSSKRNGGSLGWLMADQLTQPLGNVVVNMAQGALSAAPIQTQSGWQIIKLEEKRKFLAPSFEESKPQLIQGLLATQRAEYVQQLIKVAKIEN